MSRSFEKWFSTFDDSIASWTYYTDFAKIYKNANSLKNELNLLNGLIGSKNIEYDFKEIYNEYPKIIKAIPILIAKRLKDIIIVKSAERDYYFNFRNINYSIDDYIKFMRKSGILDLFENHLISNVYDYVLGVEAGMDTNARKNRTGDAMEDLVEEFILDAGYIKNVNYFKEMDTNELKRKFNIDITAILEKIDRETKTKKGKLATKRFDFVIKTKYNIYLIETNFYNSNGSKLNETARSYKMLFSELSKIDGIKFCWFTDGDGWKKAKSNLEETFSVTDNMYNIADLKSGIINNLK